MRNQIAKPRTIEELLTGLEAVHEDLGKGGRRLARFFIDNPHTASLLTAAEVAVQSGVHASSVVRLAQSLGLSGYRELQTILQQSLTHAGAIPQSATASVNDAGTCNNPLSLVLLAESGRSFNETAQSAAEHYQQINTSVNILTESVVSHKVDPSAFASRIHQLAESADGLILVAREHPAINNAVREVTRKGIPVICLTTDLPSSGRTTYVGSDQFASGATAGWLCGRFLTKDRAQKVLLVSSVPFRCQLEREQGFRQALRSEFPSLTIEEKVGSDEDPDIIYTALRRYIARNAPPAAIYNVSGANVGIGQALEAEGLVENTVFIGHELNANSRKLLENGIMDLTIGHDFEHEIAIAVESIRMARSGVQPVNHLTQSQIFTRFNCTAT